MIQTQLQKIRRVLIANRGEIAVRIIQACRSLGVESVVLYSDADAHTAAVELATFAISIGGNTPAESYLDVKKVLHAAKQTKADAVHPGYGFLAENADFASACIEAGLAWIGPSATAIQSLGDKIAAKRMMQSAGVPTVPGSDGAVKTKEDVLEVIEKIGLPVIVKAAAGGGGRGMRIVKSPDEAEASVEACQREALAYFGNPEVFVEKYIENPRHIEVQILADSHGKTLHLFERDCSIQRRHQKLIEEAPSVFLTEALREKYGKIAVKAAEAANYEGAGTVEFICNSPEEFYFMEMNTRIQVEHPVTEWITGVDLIAEQIRVADGQKLGFEQKDLAVRGYAFECRINAEDPVRGFLPQSGDIGHLYFPRDPFSRVDTFLEKRSKVTGYYDSMIAKLICWGETREIAMNRMQHLLGQLQIQGIATTAILHEWLLQHTDFRAGKFTTRFLEDNLESFERWVEDPRPTQSEKDISDEKLALGISTYLVATKNYAISGTWQVNWTEEQKYCVRLPAITEGVWHSLGEDQQKLTGIAQVKAVSSKGQVFFKSSDGVQTQLRVRMQELSTYKKTGALQAILEVCGQFGTKRITPLFCPYSPVLELRGSLLAGAPMDLDAPITGKVLQVLVEKGAVVEEGQVVCIIEAMKMENKIGAPMSGLVSEIHTAGGDQVKAGDPLMGFAAQDEVKS